MLVLQTDGVYTGTTLQVVSVFPKNFEVFLLKKNLEVVKVPKVNAERATNNRSNILIRIQNGND